MICLICRVTSCSTAMTPTAPQPAGSARYHRQLTSPARVRSTLFDSFENPLLPSVIPAECTKKNIRRARVTSAQACRTAHLGSVFLCCAEQRRAASGAAVTLNVTGNGLIVVVFTVLQECAALGLTKPNGSIFNKNKDRKVRRVPLMSLTASHVTRCRP